MNRYLLIQDEALKLLEDQSYGFYKRRTLSHMFQVETLCVMLARIRHLNQELAAICGLLHDLSIGIDCNDFAHAQRSSAIAQQLMTESQQFSDEEITIVVQAIAHHSNKEQTDDDYSEIIKDSDVLSHLYNGEILKPAEEKRYQHLKEELSR